MTYTLLTRCQEDNQDTAKDIADLKLNVTPLSYPILEITPLDFSIPQDISAYQTLIFTSRFGVRAALTHNNKSAFENKDIFCVGEKTASLSQGLSPISVIWSRDVNELGAMLSQIQDQEKVLYLSGKDVKKELDQEDKNIIIERIAVYEATLKDPFDQKFQELYQQNSISYALFYSMRTAEQFCALMDRHSAENAVLSIKNVICISADVADVFSRYSSIDVHIAKNPNHSDMLKKLEELVKTQE